MNIHFIIARIYQSLCIRTIYFSAGIVLLFNAGCIHNDPVSSLRTINLENVDFIAVYGEDTVEITWQKENWLLSGGWSADPTAVDNFFYALQNFEITGATSGEDLDSLRSRRIVFREKNRLKKFRFYAGDNFYLIHHEGSVRVYRVQVKTNPDADLSRVFSDEVSEWQNRKILDFKTDNIDEILVFPGLSYGDGFLLKVTGDSVALYDAKSLQPIDYSIAKEKLLLYLSYFQEIYFEQEILTDSIKMRIYDSHPFFRFVVRSWDQKAVDFSIFPLYLPDGEKDVYFGALKFAEDETIFKVNYIFLDLIFQDLSYFSVE